ncbi:hypothetical protein BCR34DRAFT_314105 [Clohesyomyces aquaticus]|uniref:Zn(2)-C6 fungal-type domain-containing protein n=1 Tax=Clohesyomyces aquaticus TaxID=1231657 RepID=A0A1Y1ZP59_9PLEO|nr:hypothetical protein BCR34DRAFT_314105 [Clohesyomyces aquaticus]
MDARLKCQLCKKSFTQKSSLIRHSKRCVPGPAPSLRQKSCRQCTNSKTRCDLRRPKCSRCEQRGALCEYIVPLTRGARDTHSSEEGDVGSTSDDTCESIFPTSTAAPMMGLFTDAPQGLSSTNLPLDFDSSLASFGLGDFTGSVDTAEINYLSERNSFAGLPLSYALLTHNLKPSGSGPDSLETTPDSCDFESDDWLLWRPGPKSSTPPLVRHSMETLLRVIKTWPKTLVKGLQTPPMLHFSHVDPTTRFRPMANCIAITAMWTGQSDGATDIVRQTVLQEMRSLFEQYRSMDERQLLAALQALVFYTTILMFPGRGQLSLSIIDPAIFLCLQKVTSYVAQTGLMLTEERDHERPSWDSWVHVTAKRRAVFILYLLHWSYSVYHNLPSFECRQLGFMPAPAPKFLWQAETKEKWEDLYNRWLGQWGDSPYMMHEFAAIQSGPTLENRTETWLEDADELGVLFFSIVNANEREDIYELGIPVLS